MEKLVSIILVIWLLLAFVSCGSSESSKPSLHECWWCDGYGCKHCDYTGLKYY